MLGLPSSAWLLGFLTEKSWIFDMSCQDLGHYSWQGVQDFARFFKIVERNA